MSDSPEELVGKIKEGNKQAEQALVTKYYKSLEYILLNRSSDRDLTYDIAQETFIVVLEKARKGEIDNPAAVGAFIRNVGVNLLIASYRKESRHKTENSEDIEDYFTKNNQPQLHDQLNSKKVSEMVMQMMEELPTDRDRDILLRYFVHGHEKDEVCQVLELSTAHFDRVLHRARSRLKQILQYKYNIEIGELSISHLLCLSLLCLPILSGTVVNTLKIEKNVSEVRGNADLLHTIHTMEKSQLPDAEVTVFSKSRGVNELID